MTLAVMGVCALVWIGSDYIVAWGLSRDIVTEASIAGTQATLKYACFGVGGASLLFSYRLLRRLTVSIWAWGPMRALTSHAKAGLQLLATRVVGVTLRIMAVVVKPIRWTARMILTAVTLAYMAWRAAASSALAVWRLCFDTARTLLAAGAVLIWRWVGGATKLAMAIVRILGRAVTAVLTAVILLAFAVLGYGLVRMARARRLAWSGLATAFAYIRWASTGAAQAGAWLANQLWKPMVAVLRLCSKALATVYGAIKVWAEALVRASLAVFRYAWRIVAGFARTCRRYVWKAIGYGWYGIRLVASAIGRILWQLRMVANAIIGLVWMVVVQASRLVARSLARILHGLFVIFAYGRAIISTAIKYIGKQSWRALVLVGRVVLGGLRKLWATVRWAFALADAVGRLIDAWFASALKRLWGAEVIAGRSLAVAFRRAWFPISLACKNGIAGALAVSRFIWNVITATGLGTYIVLRYAYIGGKYVAWLIVAAVSSGWRFTWSAIVAAARPVGMGMAIAGRALRKASFIAWKSGWTVAIWILTVVRTGSWFIGGVVRDIFRTAALVARMAGCGLSSAICLCWTVTTAGFRYAGVRATALLVRVWSAAVFLMRSLMVAAGWVWLPVSILGGLAGRGAMAIVRSLGMGLAVCGRRLVSMAKLVALIGRQITGLVKGALSVTLAMIWAGIRPVFRGLVIVVFTLGTGAAVFAGAIWKAVIAISRFVWLGAATFAQCCRLLMDLATAGIASGFGYIRLGTGLALQPVALGATAFAGYLRTGGATLYMVAAWAIVQLWSGTVIVLRSAVMTPVLAGRTAATGIGAIPDAALAGIWMIQNRKGVRSMTESKLTRDRFVSLAVTMVVFFTAAAIAIRIWTPLPPEPTVEVVHWATGHLFRNDLLPRLAEEFNQAKHVTDSGKVIVVKVQNNPSSLQADDLQSRVTTGVRHQRECCPVGSEPHPDPTIVTPSSEDRLIRVNQAAGYQVVDPYASESIARAYIGIITYRDMAECLGWPQKEIGYQDIIELRADPQGWAKYPCAKPSWGERPLVAFTDPKTSSTGRSVLLALYAMAAGMPPEILTLDDIYDDDVVRYVRDFQGLIDHYFIGTTVMNTKIHQGPQFGQFFLMPEDNLIHLYEGTERAYFGGIRKSAPKIKPNSMVMIYPKEGSMARNNCACIVTAPWVTPEHVEGANLWIDFLREDEQQLDFMDAGFRSVTDIPLTHPRSKITAAYGLTPRTPAKTMNVALIKPDVAAAIDESWNDVKRTSVVTFVVDTSGSMLGNKMKQAKEGLILALDNMAPNNQVGYVSFDDTIHTVVPVGHLSITGPVIVGEIRATQARGETALYDAVRKGVQITDGAEGPVDAIRAVVVLTDGQANKGATELDNIIGMMSNLEKPITQFSGFVGQATGIDSEGNIVPKERMIGVNLKGQFSHPVQIFFIGIGEDADLEVGRMFAGATFAEFQGVAEEDLANLLAEFSGYF